MVESKELKEDVNKLTIQLTEQLMNIGTVDPVELMTKVLAGFRASNVILATSAPSTETYIEALENMYQSLKEEGLEIREKVISEK